MVVEWLFEINGPDTFYAWSTKDTEFNNTFYRGIVDPNSFTGISEAQTISTGVVTPSDTTFSLVLSNSVLKDPDYFNIFDEDTDSALEAYVNELSEIEFKNVIATVTLLINGSYHKSWNFKVKRVEQYYRKAKFWLESILTGYLEGDFPNTKHPREIWKTESERSDNYVVPYIFGKGYIPLRSIFEGTSRYYVLGKDSYSYIIDRVSSPKEWPNQSFWDDSYSYPQTTTKGYKVFQAIIADSDGDLEPDANGLWQDGEFFHDMPSRVTCDIVPYTSQGASPADVIALFLQECGVPSEFIDISGTFTIAKTTFQEQGIYWNGGIYLQEERSSILSSLLAQCNATLKVSDKIELHPNSTISVASLNSSSIVKGSYSTRPSWPKVSDGGYISFPASDYVPQDNLSEALVWSSPVQSSADDIRNPSSSKLELPFVRDSIIAQKLGVLHFNKTLNKRGSVSFTLMPTEDIDNFTANKVLTIDDDIYGNTANVLISSSTINRDLTINVEAVKFIDGIIGFEDVVTEALDIADLIDIEAWKPATTDEFLNERSISLTPSRNLVPFYQETLPIVESITLNASVKNLSACEGIYLEISRDNAAAEEVEMLAEDSENFYYVFNVTEYAEFPVNFNAVAYKTDGTRIDLISAATIVDGVINGASSYSILLGRDNTQVLCDSQGAPREGELGSGSGAETQISVLRGDIELVATDITPIAGEFQLEIIENINCTAFIDTDFKTIVISDVEAESGYVEFKIYLEGSTVFTSKKFSFVKVNSGRRGGVEYFAKVSSSIANDWSSGDITNTTASVAAETLIALPENEDANIVPGDRLTLQDELSSQIMATRIYQGALKVSGNSFSASDWSLISVGTIDGSLIVDGTIYGSAIVGESITGNEIDSNTINTSNLTFTPLLSNGGVGEVVGTINASTEGIRISSSRLSISGSTYFYSGYDPSTKETPSGAQAKATLAESNANSYTDAQISNIEASGSAVIRAISAPSTRPDGSALETGDMWIDTDDGDKPRSWDGSSFILMYTSINGGYIETGSITADKIESGSITTSELSFTPVETNNVIASINSSPETGLTIDSDKLTISSSDITLDSNTTVLGTFKVTAADNIDDVESGADVTKTVIDGGIITTGVIQLDSTDSMCHIQTTNYSSGVTGWRINNAGDAEFNDITVRGSISTASVDGVLDVGVGGKITAGNTSLEPSGVYGPDFSLNNGGLTATNVSLSGDITATSGSIGGWTAEANKLTSGNIELNSSIPSIKVDGTDGYIEINNSTFRVHNKNLGTDVFYADINGGTNFTGEINQTNINVYNSSVIRTSESPVTDGGVIINASGIIGYNNDVTPSEVFNLTTTGDITVGDYANNNGIFYNNSTGILDVKGSLTVGSSDLDSTILDINGNITTGLLTADNITTGTLDASSITVNNLDASNITTGTLTGDYITGGTITGSTIQTSSSGERLEMDATSNEFRCYNTTGNLIAGIGDKTWGADNATAYFETADEIAIKVDQTNTSVGTGIYVTANADSSYAVKASNSNGTAISGKATAANRNGVQGFSGTSAGITGTEPGSGLLGVADSTTRRGVYAKGPIALEAIGGDSAGNRGITTSGYTALHASGIGQGIYAEASSGPSITTDGDIEVGGKITELVDDYTAELSQDFGDAGVRFKILNTGNVGTSGYAIHIKLGSTYLGSMPIDS